MKRSKKIYLFIPLMLLITISCTCGGQNFRNMISNTNLNDIVEEVESEGALPENVQEAVEVPEIAVEASGVGAGLTGGDVEVYDVNHFYDDDYVTIIGILRNNTNKMISGLDLSIIFYDADGKIVATDLIYPAFSLLPPGEAVPFSVYSGDWPKFERYEFILVDYYETYLEVVEGVLITNERLIFGNYTPIMLGEIENTSTVPIEWVNVAIMVYDKNDILIDAVNTYAMVDNIAPGEKSPFKMYLSYGWEDYDHYDLVVQASEADVLPADMTVTDYEVTEDDYSTTFTGTVINNSSEVVSFATIVASFYNSSGELVGAEWTYVEEEEIAAKGTGTFELTLWDIQEYNEVVFQVQ
jgi:hypothetical protein